MAALIEEGDWVAATRTIPVTIADHIGIPTGVRPGTRGVVTERTGNRLVVEFHSSFGLQRVRTTTNSCRLIRKRGGTEAFRSRASWGSTIRLGIYAVFTFPIVWYILQYWITYGNLTGVLPALATAALDQSAAFLLAALQHPIQAAIYLAACWLGRHLLQRL